jgi:tRNA(Ser,Leu) C12 N-acetylase TAN1
MIDWNVVVTINEGGLRQAFALLGHCGTVRKTVFFNVLVMNVPDQHALLEDLRAKASENPELLSPISRLIPVTRTFLFQSPEEFEAKAKEAVLTWVPELFGMSFHVRMHRRGFRGAIASPEEERLLDGLLLNALAEAGRPGRVTFEDPDVILAVETVAQRAGLSLWPREDRLRYPFVRLC